MEENLESLFEKYAAGSCSAEEARAVEHWLHLYRKDKSDVLTDEYFDGAKLRMLSAIDSARFPPAKKVRLWPRIAIAAAVAAVFVCIGILVYQQSSKPKVESAFVNDVDPGKAGATLKLASGRLIRLSEVGSGKLAQESGIEIAKNDQGQLVYTFKDKDNEDRVNTLSTGRGETVQLALPDGSRVWLNSASSLTYSAALVREGLRRVSLSGEAYFEVAKDKTHPFVVESRGQEVRVLGTHFNVNGYADEPAVATTLLEGSVRVSAGGMEKVLAPGEQSLNAQGSLQVRQVDAEGAVDWKNGEFALDEVDFRVAMRKIARWYDVEVVYGPSVPDNIRSWGYISRDIKLSSILKVMEKSGRVHFRIEGRKVYVTK